MLSAAFSNFEDSLNMKNLLAVALLFSLAAACAHAADEPGFVALFDGKTLKGWEGNQDVFRVVDGAIVGGSLDKPVARNEFLCTRDEYGDFELRAEFKLVGRGANGGIQFRSRRIPNHHEVRGYQADLGDGWWGSLYDESRRNKVMAAADKEVIRAALKHDDWNEYRIRCEGPHIQLWINGQQTVDYTEKEPGIEPRGLIGLQIHGGGPSEAWYRSLRVKAL
jgi:hypothetical protein